MNICAKPAQYICLYHIIGYRGVFAPSLDTHDAVDRSFYEAIKYDKSILLIHHSVLTMDKEPLRSSFHITDFIRKHRIKDIFCSHTYRLDLQLSRDLYLKIFLPNIWCGTLSSSNRMGHDNQFLYLKNWGTDEIQIHLIRIFLNDGVMSFAEELI